MQIAYLTFLFSLTGNCCLDRQVHARQEVVEFLLILTAMITAIKTVSVHQAEVSLGLLLGARCPQF